MSRFKKFEEWLSSKDKFYSSLIGQKINEKDHGHVFIVWNKFKMKTVGKFKITDLYIIV